MKNDTLWYESIPDPREGRRQTRMTPNERLAHQIKDWRQREGMSQVWLAAKAGTTQRVISLLEAGKYNPTLELLERLAKAMDKRLDVAFWPVAR